MSRELSLNIRLAAIISILLVALFACIGFSAWASRAAKNDTKVVNVAGRQRMLTQKYTKEILDELNDRQAIASAEQIAAVASRQIVADRVQYTSQVIGKLKKEWPGFKAGADYSEIEGAIPLPATFVREVSENFDESAGYRFDLLSKWNINQDKRLRDKFEEEAWNKLAADPKNPYYAIQPRGAGLEMRYATADLASTDACVSCHNAHPGSPKTDFVLNDLMGILVVSVPVTDDPAWTQALLKQIQGSEDPLSEKTRELFEVSMEALIDGGQTYSDLGMTQTIELPGAEVPEIRTKLLGARDMWSDLQICVTALRSLKVGSPEYLKQLRLLRTKNMETLAGMNAAVGMFQTASEARTTLTTNIQYFMGVAAVFIFLGVVGYIRRKVSNPLTLIAEALGSGASQVHSASSQVARSSTAMADGASQQASSIEETSASLEEMSTIIHQNSDNAKQASQTSDETLHAAKQGREAMSRMSGAIAKIKSSSEETAQIIKTIDEIAFQTNILALNAAVEAARAGEAGMGFAVVADEVRNLAQRSAKAARDTSALIEESQQNAHNGVTVTEEVGRLLEQIAEGVNKVTLVVKEVTNASDEQSHGIDQLNKAMEQMNTVTQSNAASSEESAAASEELAAQADELNGMVEQLSGIVGGNRASSAYSIEMAEEPKAASRMITPAKARALPRTVKKNDQPKIQATRAPVAQGASRKQSAIPMGDDFEEF